MAYVSKQLELLLNNPNKNFYTPFKNTQYWLKYFWVVFCGICIYLSYSLLFSKFQRSMSYDCCKNPRKDTGLKIISLRSYFLKLFIKRWINLFLCVKNTISKYCKHTIHLHTQQTFFDVNRNSMPNMWTQICLISSNLPCSSVEVYFLISLLWTEGKTQSQIWLETWPRSIRMFL